MARTGTAPSGAAIEEIVGLLVDVEGADTVYADVYRGRARELLGGVLSASDYSAFKGLQRQIDEALQQTRAATMAQDWRRVAALAARVDELRRSAEERSGLAELGAKVYEASAVKVDPFSPGFAALPDLGLDLAVLRDELERKLERLAEADRPLAALYGSRKAFFAGFALAAKHGAAAVSSVKDSGDMAQLAAQAAQRGDVGQLRQLAEELLARGEQEKKADPAAAKAESPSPALGAGAYRCPVDLTVPLSPEVAARARALGFAVSQTEPLAQAAPLVDYVTARVWQADFSESDTEREGTMRADTLIDEAGFPPDVAAPIKALTGQFLRNLFVNSGGARYLPHFGQETVLIEDFPEGQEAPAEGELLAALGLTRRRALSRQEIESALLQRGATVLKERLQLDPLEHRLVCIPQDLYMRFGREKGWGQQESWTHFDGYQVLRTGRLRALVGGSARYGGLNDLVSIAANDQREGVIARFAVIRRARQVARWH